MNNFVKQISKISIAENTESKNGNFKISNFL